MPNIIRLIWNICVNKKLVIRNFTKLYIIILALALDLFWLPSMAKLSVEFSLEVAYLKYPVLLGIYLTCILHTLKILRLIEKVK